MAVTVYKVAPFDSLTQRPYSEFGGKKTYFSTEIGSIIESSTGIHTSLDKRFVLDFYTELTDDDDVLLKYKVEPGDIMKGQGSEVIVRRATLVDFDHIIVEED